MRNFSKRSPQYGGAWSSGSTLPWRKLRPEWIRALRHNVAVGGLEQPLVLLNQRAGGVLLAAPEAGGEGAAVLLGAPEASGEGAAVGF